MTAHDEQRPSKALLTARVSFHDERETPSGPLPYHYHDSYEIFCSKNRSLTYRVNGAIYRPAFGDILVLNQFDIHQSLAEPGKPYHRNVTIFYPELVSTWSVAGYDLLQCFERRAAGFRHLVRLTPQDRRRYEEIFARGVDSARLPEGEREMVQRILVAELLVVINRGARIGPTAQPTTTASAEEAARLETIIRYVDEHFTEDLTLQRLATQFGTTVSGLNRLCRRAGRVTMHQYLIRRRIECARLELSRGRTVTDAAYASGFGNLSHFVRIFRQKTGLSPKEFQRKILEHVRS